MVAINVDNLWVEDATQIKMENWIRLVLDGIHVSQLSLEDRGKPPNLFTMKELGEVINNSEGKKSPGLDGYNFNFIK